MRIPELSHPRVRHSGQCASGWRSPVGHQNWLPYNQRLYFPLWMLCKKLLGCGGPPQAKWSGGRKHQNQARQISIRIKRTFERTDICRCKRRERLLAGWDRPRSLKKVDCTEQNRRNHHAENDELLFHFPASPNPPATNPAICCGNRIIPKTITTAAQSNTLPSHRPRIAHCLARCCCQNPKPISAIESPKSHGRKVAKKALAAPAPSAAANPSGRQQLTIARELRIAPTDAETPVPCFTALSLFQPRSLRAEPFPQAEGRSVSTRDTNDN